MELVGHARPAAGLWLCTMWLLPVTEPAAAPAVKPGRYDVGEAREEEAKRVVEEPAPTVEGPKQAPGMTVPRGWTGLQLRGDRSASGGEGPALKDIGDGRLQHQADGFRATIAADGSVEFHDVLVKPKVVLLGFDLVAGKFELPRAPSRDAFEERAVFPFGPGTAAMLATPSIAMPGLADMLIKHRFARAKLRFLRETEALRTRMAHAWLKQRLAEELDALVARIMAIWRESSLPLVERRRRIFVAWDECEELRGTEASVTDETRAAGGMQARERIVRLVRLIAPRGSAQQYTPAELLRLNAGRRSAGRFEPYAGE